MKLCYDYSNLAYGFSWLLKARSGYKLDAKVAKTAKFTDQVCPNHCPCYHNEYQGVEHWLHKCPFFNIFYNKFQDEMQLLFSLFSDRNPNNFNPYSSSNIFIKNFSTNDSSDSLNNNISNIKVIENNVYNNSIVCVIKFSVYFLGEEVIISVQGNGMIYLIVS